jgi:peptidoglycan/xylan/chitin deacetylase (PgdA/CDA1 family)
MTGRVGWIKKAFLALFLLLACLMFGGAHFLGREIPSSRKLVFWRAGAPPEFNYLSTKVSMLETEMPAATYPPSDAGNAQSIPVLLYHGISEKGNSDVAGWDTFNAQMKALKASGYQTVSLARFEAFLLHGIPLPIKSFLLTFDDSRKDSFYPADPVLQALDYRAVMFVITSTISEDDDFYLSEKELKEMVASGRWELESHGRNIHQSAAVALAGQTAHALSNRLWLPGAARLETEDEYEQRVAQDLAESKHDLESRFGISVDSFAYPYGDYGQKNGNNADRAAAFIRTAVSSTYHLAFYQAEDRAFTRNYPRAEGFMARRFEVDPKMSPEDLLNIVRGGEDKPGNFSSSMPTNDGWIPGWGGIQFSPGSLTLLSDKDTTGASSYLGGTYLWTDFTLTLRARLLRGESFSILARVDNQKNYVYCSFGKNGVSYNEHVNGEDVEGPGWYTDLSGLGGLEMQAGISVQGRHVRCLFNGTTRVDTIFIKHAADHGMVGLGVWGPEKGASAVEVTGITVTEIMGSAGAGNT